jgi:GNAT superfamily N-acetyltransferase
MMQGIVRLSAAQLRESAHGLAAVLVDAVEDGASVGFLDPLDPAAAQAWWEGLAGAVADGRLALWVARDDNRIVGTVQLRLDQTPNGRHRGEVAKLMVHRSARKQGLGRALLRVAEQAAAEAGAGLLLLDTQTGSAAEGLYRGTSWTEVGVVPDYAADPAGTLQPTTFFYKRIS